MGVSRYDYNILAYWRQGVDPALNPEDTPRRQELALRLYAAGRACVHGVLRSVHRTHGHNTTAMADGDTRPERDQVKQLQLRLKPRYTLWSIYYPAGAQPETLTAMQEGLRAGEEVLKEERMRLTESEPSEPSLPGPDDTGTSHYTGELYVPGPRVRLGHLWIPDELQTLNGALQSMPPSIPSLPPGPQQPLPPPQLG